MNLRCLLPSAPNRLFCGFVVVCLSMTVVSSPIALAQNKNNKKKTPPKPAKINLIPFNPFPGTRFKRSSADTIRHFQNRLRQQGLVATTRRTRGADIDAACGQLAGKVSDRVRTPLGQKTISGRKPNNEEIKVASA